MTPAQIATMRTYLKVCCAQLAWSVPPGAASDHPTRVLTSEALTLLRETEPADRQGTGLVKNYIDVLDYLLDRLAEDMKASGAYMPALATLMRAKADEMADRFPDDTNGGTRETRT